jgi:excisionase family DNA binding protein
MNKPITFVELDSKSGIQAEKLAYSIEEIADQTSLSKAYLRGDIRAGRLRVRRFGRRIVILAEDLRAYLAGANS